LKKVGSGPAVAALDAAAKAETVSVVQVQILHALMVYENLDGILDSLDGLANLMQSDIPSQYALDEINSALTWIQLTGIKSATAAQKEKLVGIIVRLLSFGGQQTIAYKAGEGSLPAPYWASASAMANSAVKLLGTIGGAAIPPLDSSAPEMMMIGINDLVGSDGRPGTLQKTMPKVAIPPKVGAATTRPGPATTTSH
jgi:hypothetical protein